MNIKLKNKVLFDDLYNSSFIRIEVGSSMYGLKHKKSDTDILCIYNTSKNELNSVFKSFHQIQLKKNNTDYLFTNIHNFISNSISGESTINFEVINSKKLINSPLNFLYENKKMFINYKVLKAYTGFAKRDIKRINIDAKTDFEKNKKVTHILRSILFAEKILNNIELELSENEINLIKNKIWNISDFRNRELYLKSLSDRNEKLRKQITGLYNNNKLIKYMKIENQKYIDNKIFELLKNTKIKKADNFDLNIFYDTNENWVKY